MMIELKGMDIGWTSDLPTSDECARSLVSRSAAIVREKLEVPGLGHFRWSWHFSSYQNSHIDCSCPD